VQQAQQGTFACAIAPQNDGPRVLGDFQIDVAQN
jgi:hypothetical protein